MCLLVGPGFALAHKVSQQRATIPTPYLGRNGSNLSGETRRGEFLKDTSISRWNSKLVPEEVLHLVSLSVYKLRRETRRFLVKLYIWNNIGNTSAPTHHTPASASQTGRRTGNRTALPVVPLSSRGATPATGVVCVPTRVKLTAHQQQITFTCGWRVDGAGGGGRSCRVWGQLRGDGRCEHRFD